MHQCTQHLKIDRCTLDNDGGSFSCFRGSFLCNVFNTSKQCISCKHGLCCLSSIQITKCNGKWQLANKSLNAIGWYNTKQTVLFCILHFDKWGIFWQYGKFCLVTAHLVSLQSQAEAHYKGNRHARRVKGIENAKTRQKEGTQNGDRNTPLISPVPSASESDTDSKGDWERYNFRFSFFAHLCQKKCCCTYLPA